MSRPALDDSPLVWVVDNRDLDSHLPYGCYLVQMTEFGVSLAWREEPYDTWSPPLPAKEAR